MRSLSFALLLSFLSPAVSDPLETVDDVAIDRFMGKWFVIAHIPTFLTDEAFNAVERYRLGDDNEVEVLFTFREGGFEGELQKLTPTGFIDEKDPAEWDMRLLWPFKADYRIAWLADDYSATIIGRNKRDYVWVMARQPTLAAERYQELVERVRKMGYDMSKLRQIPQQQLSQRRDLGFSSDW